MKQEIKQRIEQIKNGEVPQGYKKTKIGIVPNEWEVSKLNKFLKVCKEKNDELLYGKEDVFSISGEYGIVNQIKFLGRSYAGASVEAYRVVRSGDIVYTKSPLKNNPYGIIKANLKDKTGIVSTLYAVYKCNENVLPSYVQWYFGLDNILNNYLLPLVNIGAKNDMKISDENVLKGDVIFPKLFEQQKISKILSTQDKVIELKEKLLKEKEKQKKYLMQILLTGRKRLKGFVGEWKKVKLGKCLVEKSDKTIQKNQYPVLTSSRKGIFLQNQYFNKSVSSEDNIGYKILRKNEFTYRTMSDDGKYTFNLLEEYEIGIVSPAYSVFNVNSDKCEIKFLYYLLNDFSFNKYIMKLIQGGTRLALRYSELCKLEIKLPPLEEQKAIAEILTTADKELKLLQEELEEENYHHLKNKKQLQKS